ncbi:uncharacterized protein LOC126900280 [Daktulosphaira vitifoliae]|uniref:uncharacterized protein LOC126900280 n=1 Tax=Daktulosphaira vitifoliae TaxID=58002 RepID=UPI0021A9A3AD|nr:uncharacterized protein LOC126900280 [Daktulosphaira vitifoliae]
MDLSSKIINDYVTLRTLLPKTIEKCQSINDGELNSQVVYLEKHYSSHFSNIISCMQTLQSSSYVEKGSIDLMKNLKNNLEKNKQLVEFHEKNLENYDVKLKNFEIL